MTSREELARAQWAATAPTLDPTRLVFLDETGVATSSTLCGVAWPPHLRRYGRGPRGQRVADHAPQGRWESSTFIAALRVTGLTAPGVLDGPMDGASARVGARGLSARLSGPLTTAAALVNDLLEARDDKRLLRLQKLAKQDRLRRTDPRTDVAAR